MTLCKSVFGVDSPARRLDVYPVLNTAPGSLISLAIPAYILAKEDDQTRCM